MTDLARDPLVAFVALAIAIPLACLAFAAWRYLRRAPSADFGRAAWRERKRAARKGRGGKP